MLVRLHTAPDRLDRAILADDDRRALDALVLFPGEGLLCPEAELVRELVLVVDEQRERQVVLRFELRVRCGVLRADAEDLRSRCPELLPRVADRTRLFGTPRRVVLRIEVEDDLLPAQVREADGVAGVGLELEVRCRLAFLDHGRRLSLAVMGAVRFSLSMSLDGFIAGPNPSVEEPLGQGGEQLHDWAFGLEAWRKPHGLEGGEVNESTRVMERILENIGAHVMGRNMFGGGTGPWPEPAWNGWWGDDPPFHSPVFVVTHHPREPLALGGGTTFTFVTEGVEAALQRAQAAAGGKDVVIAGGASVAQQALAAGLVDEVGVSVAPVLLGGGTRLLDGLPPMQLELVEAVDAPGVAHLRYRVLK